MKKLFLIFGLLFFFTLSVGSEEAIIKGDLPECKVKKNKIKTRDECYGEIKISSGCTYKGKFLKRKQHGHGELWCVGAPQLQLWEKGKLVKNYSVIEVRELKIELGIIKNEVAQNHFCESDSGNVYESPLGCFNNKTITEKEFLNKKAKNENIKDKRVFCYNKDLVGTGREVLPFKNKCNENKGWVIATQAQIDKKISDRKIEIATLNEGSCSRFDAMYKRRDCNFDKFFAQLKEKNFHIIEDDRHCAWRGCRKGLKFEKKQASFKEFAISLGCGSKSDDVDDCVRRYLPSVLGVAPMTLEDVNEFKKDSEIMGEVVHAIQEKNRQQNQSENQEPTEEEKALAQAQEQGMQNNQILFRTYDPILEKHLNSRGWTQVNPKLEKILNSIGRSQIPIKNQKRFTTITGWKF